MISMQSDSDHDMSEALQKAEQSDIICIILPSLLYIQNNESVSHAMHKQRKERKKR